MRTKRDPPTPSPSTSKFSTQRKDCSLQVNVQFDWRSYIPWSLYIVTGTLTSVTLHFTLWYFTRIGYPLTVSQIIHIRYMINNPHNYGTHPYTQPVHLVTYPPIPHYVYNLLSIGLFFTKYKNTENYSWTPRTCRELFDQTFFKQIFSLVDGFNRGQTTVKLYIYILLWGGRQKVSVLWKSDEMSGDWSFSHTRWSLGRSDTLRIMNVPEVVVFVSLL